MHDQFSPFNFNIDTNTATLLDRDGFHRRGKYKPIRTEVDLTKLTATRPQFSYRLKLFRVVTQNGGSEISDYKDFTTILWCYVPVPDGINLKNKDSHFRHVLLIQMISFYLLCRVR